MRRTFGNWLTEQEAKCVLAYLTNGRNKIKAAKAAGYYGKNDRILWDAANRCLNRKVVKEAMKEYLERVADNVGISPEFVLKKLKKMANTGAKDIKGKEDEVALIDPATTLSSLDMVNKMMGYYATQKTESKHIIEDSETLKDLIKQHEKPY